VLRYLYISIILLTCFFPAAGQVKVIDASSISINLPVRFFPDVEGKVVVDESYFNYLSSKISRDDISVFPGWPVSRAGTNERGGVYGNLDDDPELELVYPLGSALYAFNIDGSDVTGWPKTLDYPTDGAASFGDIDGDGIGEIVVTTHQTATFAFGTIYAFEINGTDVAGFPVATEGGGVRTPVLADLDNDGALEIIIAVRNWPDGLIYVYYGDGTIFPNWPQRMDYVPGSAVAVGDINGDEIPEIVAESYYGLHAFTFDGHLMEGFPYFPGPGRVFSYSSPVLADLDNDGNREIICGDHSTENGSGAVHIVKYNGNSWVDWPKITGSWIYGPPSIGDINNDGLLDIAVGDQTLSATPLNKVYAWTALTGDPLPGFPITDVFGINSQIILADFDGDDMIELMTDDNTAFNSIGKYPGYNHDGTDMENWPLETAGSTFFINPLAVDINLDGIMDISGGGNEQSTGITSVYMWNAGVEFNSSMAVLPILQYNTRHNGVYGDTLMVGLPDLAKEINETWKIFPNPASTHLTVISPDLQEKSQLELYNSKGIKMSGQSVHSKNQTLQLDLTAYSSGIYWLVVRSNSGIDSAKKIIIISNNVR
jgi:hypothetical protein